MSFGQGVKHDSGNLHLRSATHWECWGLGLSSPCQLLLPHPGTISKAGVFLLGNELATSRIGKYLLTQAQNNNVSGYVCEGQKRSQLAFGVLLEP